MKFREIIHWAYDMPRDYHMIDCCFLSNLDAPVIRAGEEPHKSFYACEWSYHGYNLIDPSRSFAEMILETIRPNVNESSGWPSCDMLGTLMTDLTLKWNNPSKAEVVAFWTMFPVGTSEFLFNSYDKYRPYLNPHENVLRVINNPCFYGDTGASDGRLVEIAEYGGFVYAVDRAKLMPRPDVIAREIALLNHGLANKDKVPSVEAELSHSISETLSNWGLSSILWG